MNVSATFAYVNPVADYKGYFYGSSTPTCGPSSEDLGTFLGTSPIGQVTARVQSNPSTLHISTIITIPTTWTGPIFVCASVTDSATTATLWSGPASYFPVPPISSFINNEANAVSIDSGQSLLLTDYVSGGAAPYLYFWYTGSSCLGTPISTTPATSPYSPSIVVTPTGTAPYTTTYSVYVIDSSIGSPDSTCEVVTVTVNVALQATFTVENDNLPTNLEQGSGPLTGVVNWAVPNGFGYPAYGTGPWYAVTIYSGTDYTCSKDTTKVASINDVNATEAILSFPEPSTPSSITYYCAVLSDSSAGIPNPGSTPGSNPLTLGPVEIDVSPALSTPSFSLASCSGGYCIYPPVTDYTPPPAAQATITLAATVTWTGGTSPYGIWLFAGSSAKSCLSENINTFTAYTPVGTWSATSGGVTTGPYTGPLFFETSATDVTFTFTSPTVSTYFCAFIEDSSGGANQPTAASASFSPPQLFEIEPLLAVNPPMLSTTHVEELQPFYEGNQITATVTWSGGTGPFVVTFYQGVYTASSPATCTPMTMPVPLQTTGFNPATGVAGDSATFTFLAPNTPGTYCYYATVTDSNGNTATSLSTSVLTDDEGFATLNVANMIVISTNPLLTFVEPTPPLAGADSTDAGQTESVTATVTWSGGSPSYTAKLTSGPSSTCSLDTTVVSVTSGSNPVTGILTTSATFVFKSPPTTTYYCFTITDSSVPMSTATSGSFPWTVNQPPTVSLPPGAEINAGTGTTLTATILTPGTSPDWLQWFVGAGCVAADAVTAPSPLSLVPPMPITSPPQTMFNTGVLSGTTTYSVQITDSSSGTPAASDCATETITTDMGPMAVAVDNSAAFSGEIFVAGAYSPPLMQNTISVIDSDSNTVVTTIQMNGLNLGTGYPVVPTALAVDSVNDILYVAGVMITSPTTSEGVFCTVSVATTQEIHCYVTSSSTSSFPDGIAVDNALGLYSPTCTSNCGQVYIADAGLNTLSAFQMTNTGLGESQLAGSPVAVGSGASTVAVDQNTYTVYVADGTSNTVSVVQPRLNPAPAYSTFAVTTVNVGFEPVGIAVNALNDEVYVANSGSGTVSVLNGFTYATIATIKVGGAPTGIDINYAAGTAYVANAATNTVSVINLATNAVVGGAIPVGYTPVAVAVDAENGSVIVANNGSNTVSVINLATNQVIATIVVP